MGDHQRGFILGYTLQLGLNTALIGGIERTGGFVKNKYGRVFEQGSGNGHALFFSARQLQTALTNHGLVSRRRRADEVVDMGSARCCFHVFQAAAGSAVGNVVLHRIVKQHRVLRHDAYGCAQTGLGQRFDLLFCHINAAFLNIVKPVQQPGQCGFPRTGGPHHRHRFSRRNVKTDVVQDRSVGLVGEGHIGETHTGIQGATRQAQGVGIWRIRNFLVALHQGEHFFQVDQILFQLPVNRTQKIQRNVDLNHECVDHDQVTQGHPPIHDPLRGAPQHRDQTAGNDQLLARIQNAEGALAGQSRTAVAL